ncbi:MAG: LysM peptidoglycan-binding domain-containing protein [Elusimicrobiota bacterium]|nr:LysM peptidoglycan-binding domain-containing protein [Elusimicrobiota bacterium]
MRKFIILITIIPVTCYSGYVETTYSAEAFRLANNIAKSYTVESVFFNPASLKNVVVPELALTYNLLYPKFTDKTELLNNSAVFVQKIRKNIGLGLGFNQFGVREWYVRDKFIFSVGGRLTELVPNFYSGIKIVYSKETYSLDEYMRTNPVFSNGNEKSVVALNIGMLYYTDSFGDFGLTIENINRPNVGLYTVEYLPVELNIGNAYYYKNLTFYPGIKVEIAEKIDYSFSLSGEYSLVLFNQKLQFLPSMGIIYGSRQLNKLLFGFSLQTSQIKFTYGISVSPVSKLDIGHSQCLTLSYKFLPQPISVKISKDEYDRLVSEKTKLEEELEKLKKGVGKKYEVTTVEEKPATVVEEKKVEQPVTTEDLLMKKIEELERKLKEAEVKRETVEEKPKPTPTTAIPPATKKRYHTVVAGDTLPKLAEKYYGDSTQWRKIYEANKDKIIRGQLVPGSVLEIP